MKKYYPLFILLIAIGFLFFMPRPADAACSKNQVEFYIVTRDADGELAPNINFIVYEQYTNPDGNPYLGSTRATGITDAGGQITVCVGSSNTDLYAVKFYQYNSNYGYRMLWNNEISGGNGFYTVEVFLSYLQMVIRDAEGTLLKDIKFDIYVQEYDIDGKAIIGENRLNQEKLVSNKYMTGVTGTARAYLTSSTEWHNGGIYVIRIHGTGSAYFYLWERRLPDIGANYINYHLSTLRLIQEDAYGSLQKNRKFSIYNQAYDAHRQPAFGSAVAENLDVGPLGSKDVYLPAGEYAMKVPSSVSGEQYTKWRITMRESRMNQYTYRLGGLHLTIYNDKGELLTNQKYTIAEQGTDAAGNPTVVKNLISSSTGVLGYNDLYLIPRKYVLIYGTKRLYNVEVFENQVTVIDYPRAMSLRPAGGEAAITTSLANNNFTVRALPAANVQGISVRKQNVGTPFQVRADQVRVPYIITFFFNKEALSSRGINTDKLRIAFYNGRTRRWSIVGNIYYSLNRLAATVRDPGIFTLIEMK
ncbi:MAG: hypothetical protein WC544_01515 [Patescibacteria group bacterium]